MADTADKLSFVGEINVTKVELVSYAGKTVDVSSMMAEISLYEGIFENTMSGYLLIEDSMDLINNFPLIGQEFLNLEMSTPTCDRTIKKTFYVHKLHNRIAKKRSQTYMLSFCARELVSSANAKVSKAYSGPISDTVSSIFRDSRYLASDSTLYIDPTKNSYPFIAPFWSPIKTINWLAAKSINSVGVPNYLFFETNQSFEFVSIDKLMQGKAEREYVYSDMDANTAFGRHGDNDSKYRVVSSIDTPVTFDYLRNLNSGMYSSKLYTIDLTTKNINQNTFDYIDDFSKSTHLEPNPMKTPDLARKKISSLYFIDKNNYQTGSFKQQGYKDFFLQRNSLIEQLSAFKILITVPGRTDIKAGAIITFTVPQLRQILEDEISESTSDYYSGRYLVTAIRHQIINGNHSMVMEIVSDSFVKQIIKR